ncbi:MULTISPECIES: hypothetical protein [Aestuariibaculum]|uniref:Uncharacterized protein n=1 Tax=Aestuariibaculum lutulentum TaxID=2920935 RepID=A0ABS9RFS3_9FLAO|nr:MULTISPECIES: hypothetical protein [Aestuariibaculum]MCH4551044.1 hypothetical protein [Aestuariibaculum lutulentum]MCR8666106.1 hypothetical protein [Aestuariibaculum sp. M13]
MKTIKVLLVLAILLCSKTIFANDSKMNDLPKTETITVEIQKILKNSNLEFNEEVSANVYFTINNKSEIVVLSIDSDSDELEQFLKYKLNYCKIQAEGMAPGRKYLIPVKLVASI